MRVGQPVPAEDAGADPGEGGAGCVPAELICMEQQGGERLSLGGRCLPPPPPPHRTELEGGGTWSPTNVL